MASAGIIHEFNVTAVDQDGNFIRPHTRGRIVAAVVAVADPRADVSNVSEPFLVFTETAIKEPSRPHQIVGSFTPMVAGTYVVKTAFLRPGEEWNPAANMSDHAGLALEERAEVRTACGP